MLPYELGDNLKESKIKVSGINEANTMNKRIILIPRNDLEMPQTE